MENVWTYREMEYVNVRLSLDCHIEKNRGEEFYTAEGVKEGVLFSK